ncbi:MAG TPA: tRNA (adenosine(37)-N6)-threonylcarbamoyltransferase complex dimerization subunit type 1 TsaB [Acidobacteriota bacterium]|nr:tRNA (adenosine(37)-N6)-threonylcarbamoyltransferase complex dimerization subunit type 1 TsaB [Acidobacteriota bacterium]
MKILAFDTSTDVCSVCVAIDKKVVAECITRGPQTHTERLMPAIELLFSQLDWEIRSLDGLAVVNGPGSFTGLRIALSVAKGLALALGIRIAAASALEVAALQVSDHGLIGPAMDARRGEIFACLYERTENGLRNITSPRSVAPEQWRSELPDVPIRFCGPGAALYLDQIKNHPSSTLLFKDFVLAETLADFAFKKFEAGDVHDASEIKAAYLRPSDAETKGPRPRKPLQRVPRS